MFGIREWYVDYIYFLKCIGVDVWVGYLAGDGD